MTRRFFRWWRAETKQRHLSLKELRAQASGIVASLREASGGLSTTGAPDAILQALEARAAMLAAIAKQASDRLKSFADRRVAAGDLFRLMQTTYGVYRAPLQPDLLKTLQVITFFWMLETVMAGGVMISGGKMDVVAGFAYGAIFALVNIILGVLTGFLGLRFLGYRHPQDVLGAHTDVGVSPRFIRRLAAVGTGVGLAGEAVLVFSAARLRALGTHDGVFDFSEVGFWATYDDSLAIVITVIGVCSAVLAIREGYSGLADPIPGYGEAYDQATATIEVAADEAVEDAIEDIETASNNGLDEADKALTAATDRPRAAEAALLEIAADIDAHNDDVVTAKDAEEARVRRKAGIDRFITGDAARDVPPMDLSAYDALILPRIEQLLADCREAANTEVEPIRSGIAKLEAAHSAALADIRAAHADFLTNAPNLDALFEEGDTHGA